MVTNVKMYVIPDLSQRVQEIVIEHGGGWLEELEAKIKYLTAPYIYLDCNKQLIYGTLLSTYETHDFKEILAYDFIASQGEQEWLPRYRELVEVSQDDKTWHKETFRHYTPNNLYPFYAASAAYGFCRPIQKPKTKTITIDGKNIEISLENFEDLKQQLCKG